MENGNFVPEEYASFTVGGELPVQVESQDYDNRLAAPELLLNLARGLGLRENKATGRIE